MKKILSMFLMLCMVVTMLPIAAMAEEADSTCGAKKEIIAFAPLNHRQSEKTVDVGTSIEDLELPTTLTATVRTNPDTVVDSVYSSENEETHVDIPVTWTSKPEYNMNAEGVYVFTPIIEGYIVSAELPQITVTVEAALLLGMVGLMSTVEEQFEGLTPGSTYYFDLSSEKGNIGMVNNRLPDTTLHYVPFTYVGTINAYSLHGRSGSPTTDSETAASNTTDPKHPSAFDQTAACL